MGRALGALTLTVVLGGCSVAVATPAPGPDYAVVEDDESYPIPLGHMPPPGECRAWYPDEPPGQQPPPGDCDELLETTPRGVPVLYRPSTERRVVRIG